MALSLSFVLIAFTTKNLQHQPELVEEVIIVSIKKQFIAPKAHQSASTQHAQSRQCAAVGSMTQGNPDTWGLKPTVSSSPSPLPPPLSRPPTMSGYRVLQQRPSSLTLLLCSPSKPHYWEDILQNKLDHVTLLLKLFNSFHFHL